MTHLEKARVELEEWKVKMQKDPSIAGRLSKGLQTRINKAIPEKVHRTITEAIKGMTKAMLFGAEFSTREPLQHVSFEQREQLVLERIRFYRNTAATEGALTGAGGFFLGLADFPLWLTLKLKMLFEIASLYGYNTGQLKERIYMLYIFQLTFSSQQERKRVFSILDSWEIYSRSLPFDINQFDWRSFQQEYRDYIDIAKLLQLIPGIGAPVGAYVNHSLTNKLGQMAMNAYRLRHEKSHAQAWLQK